jgi:hypothetical protein
MARPGAVEVVGAVPDVRPHLAAAAAVVAPVRFGTGMRGKLLEALAMGRPVVTTSVGAEGLGAVSGRHLLVADGAADLAAGIERVLADPGFAAQLGAAGRALVAERFDWGAIAAAHEDIYERVIRDPGPAPAVPEATGRPAVARLGRLPALAAGVALVGMRGLRWYLRPASAATPRPLLRETIA